MRFDVDGQRRTIGNELHDISRNEHFCELRDTAGNFSLEAPVDHRDLLCFDQWDGVRRNPVLDFNGIGYGSIGKHTRETSRRPLFRSRTAGQQYKGCRQEGYDFVHCNVESKSPKLRSSRISWSEAPAGASGET